MQDSILPYGILVLQTLLVCMHSNLFTDSVMDIPDGMVQYDGCYFASAKADSIQSQLLNNTPWRQNKITVYGKTYNEPRLTQLYGDAGISYGYSGINYDALPWTPTLAAIKEAVEKTASTSFNVCLLNLYRDGTDSNGWHADDEPELGTNPIIASVSLGAARPFHLRHNTRKECRYKILLEHGSLLIMSGATQHFYKHQIAKTARPIPPRINLTFRKIVK